MTLSVSVYSADPVRGKILHNLLRLHGFEVIIFAQLSVLKEYHTQRLPDVLIFDTRGASQPELRFLESQCCAFSNIVKIVLCSTQSAEILLPMIMEHDHLVLEPFDPESICSIVTHLAEQRSQKKNAGNPLPNTVLPQYVTPVHFCDAVFR